MSDDVKQLDIFTISKKPSEAYLYVVHDGKVTNENYAELFDSKKYNTLNAITYVSSPSFFSKIVKDYVTVKIIIGIDNADINKAFADAVSEQLNVKGADFFKGLDDGTKEKVADDRIEIRYADYGILVHSKLYLLSDTKNGDKRVIIGSANFTESAFNSEIRQYEEVMVFDNDKNFDLYSERFAAILKDTVDYIPQRAKEKFKADKAYYIDDEERAEIIVDQLTRRGALQILSEGHVRILGLAILLAKAVSENMPFIVFDDIVNSIDDDHRDGVASLLVTYPDFADIQMILTCHGEMFVTKLEERVEDPSKVNRYMFLPAIKLNERGITMKYRDSSVPLRVARENFDNKNLKDTALKCRQAVEYITMKL